jgi:Gpi18-like mannosyltransferase
MEQPYQSERPSSQNPPKNWLVESILVTIFCCLPFGIAGIVFASQVNSKFAAGDYDGAMRASRDAAKWTKIAFWVGIVIVAGGILMNVLFGVALWRTGGFNRY